MFNILASIFVILFIIYIDRKTIKKGNVFESIKNNFSLDNLFGYALSFTFLLLFIYYLLQYLDILNVNVVFNKSIISIFFSIIITPILEEYFFRYLPYKFVKDKVNRLYVMFISTILFTIFHSVIGIEYIIVFISGILLTMIYFKTENIFYSMFSHTMYNAILSYGYIIGIGANYKTLILYGMMFIIGVIVLLISKKTKNA